MAIYRQIHISFWQDGFILDLTPEEKYFYIYLMTNSKTSQCGIYELPKQIIETETGYNRETVDKLIQRFIDYGKIKYNEETKEIFLLKWIKHNSMKSPKVKACIKQELSNVKNIEYVREFYSVCVKCGYSIDSLLIDLGEKQEQEQKEEKEKEKEEEQEQKQKENPADSESRCSGPDPDLSDDDLKVVAQEFQSSGYGTINATVSETLIELISKYSSQWVVLALKEGVIQGKRKLSYVGGILRNWQADEGPHHDERQPNNRGKPKDKVQTALELVEKIKREEEGLNDKE